jgi:hypothetical protein
MSSGRAVITITRGHGTEKRSMRNHKMRPTHIFLGALLEKPGRFFATKERFEEAVERSGGQRVIHLFDKDSAHLGPKRAAAFLPFISGGVPKWQSHSARDASPTQPMT